MKIEHICFIAEGYPTNDDPFFTFFRDLVCSIADTGIKCTVIVPQSISNALVRSKRKRKYHWEDRTRNNNIIDVYQPEYISLSNAKIYGINLTQMLWNNTVIKTFKRIKIRPTLLYGHFWHSGIAAAMIGEKNNIPVFVASGESQISVQKKFSKKTLKEYLSVISGVICVSKKNMIESIDLGLSTEDKMTVIPNSINNNLFYQEDRLAARDLLGYDKDDFIVAFTGAFNDRKGVLRLSEAVNGIEGVKTIYIGSGSLRPVGDNILFCGKLPHDQIVHYLNAADIFVLPTLAEGCCNAIIEAMACGLPVISSNLPFNDDILNDENSIRVNPNDIEAIKQAIILLKDNKELRHKMSKAALRDSSDLNLVNRTKKIIEFIESKI